MVASVMAVTTLAVGMTGFSASAVEARYGGSGTFTVNGVSVNKSIDGYKSSAGGSTSCNSTLCNWVYVSVSGYYSNSQFYTEDDYATRGSVSVGFPAETGRKFIKVMSYHSATISGINGTDEMTVIL